MAPFQKLILFFFLIITIILIQADPARPATCTDDCFTQSRAAYYPNSDIIGTQTGACGYGKFGATLNNGYVSAASDLYKDGVGCGACYQVRCLNPDHCADEGVKVVITDHGASDRTDFILSRRAYQQMARTNHSAASLLALGVIDIQYRRVSCNYPGKNILFKIDEASNYPYYLAFVIHYQQGKGDIIAVQLCGSVNGVCKLLDRSYGAVWAVVSPPRGRLTIRMLLSGREDGDETWLLPTNDIPHDWKAGRVYDSGVQVLDN